MGGIVTDDYPFQRQTPYHVRVKLPPKDASLFMGSPRSSSGVGGWSRLRDEDGCDNTVVQVRIMFCTLVRDPKHSVEIILGSVGTRCFSTIHQV